MPASDLFTITGGSYTDYTEHIEKGFISFQLLGSGDITFKQNLTTYFTVIGGGGGGGGGGHNNGSAPYAVPPAAYPSGGGGGAGACGKIYLKTETNINYPYVVGNGGGVGSGNNNGVNGDDSSINFSVTDYILAGGGKFGAGHFNGNGGGLGGTLTIQGLDIIISGTSGNGGHGVKIENIGPDPSGNGLAGNDSNPISIENYPNIFIPVGGGGGGADAHDTKLPPDNPYKGGGGGNGVGGALGIDAVSNTPSPNTFGDGIDGIAYGGGGGGGGQPGVGSQSISYNITSGGNGKEGAIFVYILLVDALTNGCEWNTNLANETTEWTRAHTDCVDLDGATLNGRAMTYQDLNEKRKATIFQYKKNSAGFSKKQQYSRIARGLGQKKTTYATQSATYTNPNTNNLVLDASSVLLCPGKVKNWAFTSQNDTPGPMRKITNEPSVPLTNYIVRRTYLAGNNKWPQLGPLDPNPNSSSSSSSSPSSLLLPMVEIKSPSNNSLFYNNRIQIDYVTANFVNDYYIKILVNNVVLNIVPDEKIYPPPLTYNSSSFIIDTNTDDNYNIKLLTYTNKNIPFPATDQITVNVLVPTISINDPSSDTIIYNNTFDLFYNVTNLGDDSKIVLYQGATILDENVTTNPYPVQVLTSDSYTFKLKIVNDSMVPDPPIEDSISSIQILVPTVEITNTETTIYNNTFNLSYNVTNVGDDNKIVLYNGTTMINDNVLDNPYTFTNLSDDNYTFKLQIENNILAANPPIDSSMNITMAVPTVEIANTETTIYNNTFNLSYNVTNVDNTDNKIVLYKNGVEVEDITDPYTFINLTDGTYTFTLQIENDILTANPPIDSSMNITMKVPTISIDYPLNDAIFNSNVFELSYNVTNVDNTNNKIVLYQGTDISYNVITNPYQVKVLTSDSYTFKLKIVNDIIAPDPDIISNISNIQMEIPTVTITSPLDHPEVTIDVGNFDLSYNVVNMPTSSHLQLYTRNVGDNLWNLIDIDIVVTNYTSTSNYITVPLSSGEGNYQFKLQINNADNTPTTDAPGNYDITAVRTDIIPLLTVNNASRDVSGNYIFYYFNQSTGGSFTLQYTNIPLTQPIDILLVGGGGCGGFDGGYWGSGGGGAGAYVTGDIDPINNVQYNITIGDGGWASGEANNWGNGYNSSIIKQDGTTIVEAYGGGRGSDNPRTVNGGPYAPSTVGSGGGGSGDGTGGATNDPAGGQGPGLPGDPAGLGGTVYATRGGTGFTANSSTPDWNHYPRRGGGGGGGAGEWGERAPAGWIGGNGGDGKQWKDDEWYGGGGAGQGVDDRSNENYGGKGGGGNGGHPGVTNKGGGGGAGQYDNGGPGFKGGSGICVIRLLANSFIQDDSSIIIT